MKSLRWGKILAFLLFMLTLVSCQLRTEYFSKVDSEFKQQYILSSKREAIYKHFTAISPSKTASQYMKNFDHAFTIIYYNYIKEVDINHLLDVAHKAAREQKNIDDAFDKSLKAVTQELDPHTAWLNKDELSQLNDTVNGEYVGIGTVIAEHSLGVVLHHVYKKGPAYKAGLKAGDVITHADGEALKGKAISDISRKLRGVEGTVAQVRVLRDGDVKNFSIRRSQVEIEVLWAELKNDDIIYLRLDSFNNHSSEEIQKQLKFLKRQGGQSLILDLRANPGGLFSESITIADSFLGKKREIVSSQERSQKVNERWYSRKPDLSENIKMIVLIDEYSASASEIVAAALKDNQRAIVMGHRSFGKGSIQEVIPVSDKGALRLTFALYQSPKGKLIQASGVTPHIQIITKEPQGERLEDLEDAIIPKNRHIDKQDYSIKGDDCTIYEDDDVILNCAIELLKTNKLGSFKLGK